MEVRNWKHLTLFGISLLANKELEQGAGQTIDTSMIFKQQRTSGILNKLNVGQIQCIDVHERCDPIIAQEDFGWWD